MTSNLFYTISHRLMGLYRIHNHIEMSQAVDVLIDSYGGIADSYSSGLELNGWTIPCRWHLTDAYIELVDDNNHITKISPSLQSLFVWPFSSSVNKLIQKDDLIENVCLSDGDYRTFMFRPQYRHWENQWGFSLTLDESRLINEWNGQFKVFIDSSTSYDDMVQHVCGEIKPSNNFLLIGHLDHPYQYSDGLCGCLVNLEIQKNLLGTLQHLNVVCLSSIEIIGSVFFIDRYKLSDKNVAGAIFTAAPGITSSLSLQESYKNSSLLEKQIKHICQLRNISLNTYPFRTMWGNDEIAYESPGINISCPVFGRYPLNQYHKDTDTIQHTDSNKINEYISIVQTALLAIDSASIYYPTFTGLHALHSQQFSLYLSPLNVSGIKTDAAIQTATTLMAPTNLSNIPEPDIEYLKSNPSLLFNLMNIIQASMQHNNPLASLDLAYESDLPHAFILSYLDSWVEVGLLQKYSIWK